MSAAASFRVISAAEGIGAPTSPLPRSAVQNALIVTALLCTLPLFGQSFYYMSQWPLLYYLSKAWPVLMLLPALHCAISNPPPARTLLVIVLAFTIGLAPVTSMLQLGTDFSDALITTVKVWPFSYYFALLGMLALLQPSPRQLQGVVLWLGAATFAAMPLIWLLAPADWYSTDAVNDKFLLYDVERGYRIYMPMFFGILLLFYLNRRFAAERHFRFAIAAVACFLILLLIYKQRATIGAAACVTFLTLVSPRWRRVTLTLAATVAAIALILILFDPVFEQILQSLGGSLSVRTASLQSALGHIGEDPLSWLFGKGAVSRFSSITLAEIMGNDYFFLADIGWVGVVFEYGLVGAGLVLAVYITGMVVARGMARQNESAFILAMGDYILFMIIQSAVYSLVFAPGEMASALALAVYMGSRALPQNALSNADASAPALYFRSLPSVTYHAASNQKIDQ